MQLTRWMVDESPHSRDGLLLRGWDGDQPVTAFITRRVMDAWMDPGRSYRQRNSLFLQEYNELGKRNLAVIAEIVSRKYLRGVEFNRQYPFVEVLLADIAESGKILVSKQITREDRGK